ncbi:MAG TPA: acyl-CoA dehydrogenase family protein [Pseudonocardiaceae bacterium]|jgi:alkylation response protein AidB-like acyl-CoA dehydrogenase|nr:acyl-CoA dehydrogenase family protein [Pseudonocardiaceae bacterium]
MRFLLDDEQRRFAASLDAMLSDGAGWPGLVAAGVPALLIPEEFGGLSASPVDLAVCFEQLGRHGVPGPLVESVAVAPVLLAGTSLGEVWLPKLAAGGARATLAFPPDVPYAPDADTVDLVLLVEPDAVRVAAPGERLTSVDPTRRLFRVTAAGPPEPADSARAFEFGVLACAAYLLGAGAALLDRAAAYAKQRVQFGRPIGRFQAVKHLLADVFVGLELARPLLHGAAVTMTSRDVSAARVACGDAAYRAARTALQVHGAIGYTAEHELGRLLPTVRALYSAWGTPARHRARVMEALC